MGKMLSDAAHGTAKLHGMGGSQFDSVVVQIVKGVIYNWAGAALALWDYSDGRQAEVGPVFHLVPWKEHPKTLLHELKEFSQQERDVIEGRAMTAPLKPLIEELRRQRGAGQEDRDPLSGNARYHRCSRMGQGRDGGGR